VDEDLVSRGEIMGLLFNVADMAASLRTIEAVFRGDDAEEEDDEG
jgi:hypothetical protein